MGALAHNPETTQIPFQKAVIHFLEMQTEIT